VKFSAALVACAMLPVALHASADFDAATATNHIGLDLYRRLAAERPTGNLIISPYSIESALALAYIGAEAQTRSEMPHTEITENFSLRARRALL
jgi:serine protease inhibitor